MATRVFGTASGKDNPGRSDNGTPNELPTSGGTDDGAGADGEGEQYGVRPDDSGSSGQGDGGVVSPGRIPKPERKQKGRPKGSTGRKHPKRPATATATANADAGTRKSSTQTASDLTAILFSAHMMLAAFTKQPNFIVTEEEAAKLAKGISRVAELYDAPLLDERTRAWIGLALVGAEVYGTRIAAVVVEAKRRQNGATPPMVRPIRPAPAPPFTEVINAQA
jgi:hypothetical protein